MATPTPSKETQNEEAIQVPPGVIRQVEAVISNQALFTEPDSTRHSVGVASRRNSSAIQDNDGTAADGRLASSSPPHESQPVTRPRGAEDFLYEAPIEDAPPPAYSETYGLVDLTQAGLNTRANVANDGRVNINIDQKSQRLSNLLVPALRSQLSLQHVDQPSPHPPGYVPASLGGVAGQTPPPSLNVVIHVVGSRGDVQPFVALGKVLKETHGHRVRLATHPVFRTFIEENGLEFFSIGGDPAELMAFMVKNPGLMPGRDALRSGDIGKRRKGMYEIIKGCWRSCFEAGDGTGVEVSDSNLEPRATGNRVLSAPGNLAERPFVADAIIANPPSFAHMHCAEKLGIPLHLMFTMPWSPTQAFPHPLANIQSSNAEVSMTNFISYALVEMMTWQGLGDIINRFREKSLGLEPVSLMWAPGMATRLRIPYTYCWSPALIPKPKDWSSHISVSGFFFLSLARNYTPPADLAAFLDAGTTPIYIGFGSIVLDDPDAMTKLIFEAVKLTGRRALISKGWGGFGGDSMGVPEGIFMLGNVPHDWLFEHVSCVVHHGGAGTTAAGIALGKPTVIIPFFGDQPFWGAMVAKAGAGPLPISNKVLTASKLAAAIIEALKPIALQRAQELGELIRSEKGSDSGALSFHNALHIDSLRCSLAPSRVAVWRVKRTKIKLSAFAAAVLGNEGFLDFNQLKLYRPKEYDFGDSPLEPITGGATALLGTIGSLMMGVADFPMDIFKAFSSRTSTDPNAARGTISSASGLSSKTTLVDEQSDITRATAANRQSPSSGPPDPSRTNSERGIDHSSIPNSLRGDTAPSTPPDASEDGPAGVTSSVHQAQASTVDNEPSRPLSPQSSQKEGTAQNLSVSRLDETQMSFDTALGAGKGVGRIVGAGLKSPMDFTLSLAKGFHNAPKLYGDESVRKADRVTGFQSGLRAAGKEFGFGFYDGISGLVTQPLKGAKKEGVAGLLKGFAKGIGGVVLKPGAAIWGIPGYTFQGIYKEIQKRLGSSVQNYVIAARTAQGYEDWRTSSQAERLDVVSRWRTTQLDISQQRMQWREQPLPSTKGIAKARHMNFDQRKQNPGQAQEQKLDKSAYASKAVSTGDQTAASGRSDSSRNIPEETAFEDAIRQSVATTSTGNLDEDNMIEKAIRASVAELRRVSKEEDEDDAIQRAIQASVSQAKQTQSVTDLFVGARSGESLDVELEEALRLSILAQDSTGDSERYHIHHDWDDSGIDTDDDENIKQALKDSELPNTSPPSYADEDLRKALKQSQEDQQTHQHNDTAAKSEEQVVLEYVKKQSLAEEEHRRAMAQKFGHKD
ncbi:hypothetical protein MMC13_007876 [Lambiella insularis]|nr:hypothetical protein [Lambiella insularis]